MKKYSADSIRNVCLLAHGGVGKTSLAEALLFTSKGTTKLGRVDNGSSIFDTRPDEKERKMSISMVPGFAEWNNQKVNFLDCPGFLDLIGDAHAALRVVESAVILVDAADGVQVGTEIVSKMVVELKMPRFFFINKMDKDNADLEKVLGSLKEAYGTGVAPLVIPIGSGSSFKGAVDLVTKEAFEYAREGNGTGKKIDIPADMKEGIDAMRSALMESVAESSEELMNSFFEKGELSDKELKDGLAKGVREGTIFPVLAGSALLNMGVDQLLNKICDLAPAASTRKTAEGFNDGKPVVVECGESKPVAAFVFKTLSEEHLGEVNIARVFAGKLATGLDIHNSTRNASERVGNVYALRGHERVETGEASVGDICGLLKLKDTHTNETLCDKSLGMAFPKIAFPDPLVNIAISAKSKDEEDKVSMGFSRLKEEDVTFKYVFQGDIHQSILSTMGDIHAEIILHNLKTRFKVEVDRAQPKISYRETITKSVKYVDHTHKKQTGGAGQYAKVAIDLEPTARGEGYEFVDKIVGGVIDQSLRPSVDKGVRSRLASGILAGYPIVDLRVSLVDGKTHPVDSKDVAFQVAGRAVFKKAFDMAGPILLEPIVDLKVTVPDDYTGDVMGDLSSRRGRISGMEPQGRYQAISAKVPASEVQTYSQSLRSITQGRGFYTKTFSHYEPIPPDVAKKIIEASKADMKQDEE